MKRKILYIVIILSLLLALSCCAKSSYTLPSPGDTILFGTLPSGENIKWKVLDTDGTKALVISNDILFEMPFNDDGSENSWETSSIRNYLNSFSVNGFIGKYFTNEEMIRIVRSEISNKKREEYGIEEDSSYDYVFLPSIDDILKYYSPEKATGYMFGEDYYDDSNISFFNIEIEPCWTRSGNEDEFFYSESWINEDGEVAGIYYDYDSDETYGITPMMWIEYDPKKYDKNSLEDRMSSRGIKVLGTENGKYIVSYGKDDSGTAIEWVLLDRVQDDILLISRDILFLMNFSENEDSTWETSTLRNYLNTTFISSAFSTNENKRIIEKEISDSDEMSTFDKIFLLSDIETESYLTPSERSARYNGTIYSWWLRTKHHSRSCLSSYVSTLGDTSRDTEIIRTLGVRPAMWLSLE